ncbi:MAG: hypothetical protein WCB44_09980, partial [Stellaceae bacterium]
TTDTAGIGLNTVNVGGSPQLGSGDFINGGTLAKIGGTGTSHFSASYSGQGTVSVSTGTLEFDGPSNTFIGTLSGTGTVAFGAGSSQFSINPTIANFLIDGGAVTFSNTLSYGGNFSETDGSLTLTGSPTFSGTFALSGGTVNFSAGQTLTLPTNTSFAGGTVTGGTLALNGNTTVNGSTLIQAAVADNGTIAVNAGTLDLSGAVSGNGTIDINNSAGLEFGQASATTQNVVFTSANGVLKLDQPTVFQSPISGFQTGDTIDFAGLGATAALYSGGDLTLFNGTTPLVQLTVSTPYSRNFFSVSSDGSGGTNVTVSQTAPFPIPSDFNVDGDSDILWQNTSGQPAVWLMNGTTPFSQPLVDSNPGPSWQVVGTGNFYGGGQADILWQNTDGQAAIWAMNGTTPVGEPLVGANPGPSWQIIGTGYFNGLGGGGDSDILWQNTSGQAAIWVMNGATPVSEPLVGANPGQSWRIAGIGDFNGDNNSDILWQNTNGQAAIWLMDGTTPLAEPLVGANPGASWHIVGTGNFSGNGDSDIVWQNTNGQVAIWVMNGTTPIAEPVIGNPGPSWQVVGTGNYAGGNQSDILFQNTNGQASIWLMNGTTPTFEGLVGSNPGPSWHIHAAS